MSIFVMAGKVVLRDVKTKNALGFDLQHFAGI